VDEFQEAKALSMHTKPVLIGPVTFLLLGKARTARFDRLTLLEALPPVITPECCRVLPSPARPGAARRAVLALDRTPAERAVFLHAYGFLAERAPKVKLLVATISQRSTTTCRRRSSCRSPGCTSMPCVPADASRRWSRPWPAGAGAKARCCRSA